MDKDNKTGQQKDLNALLGLEKKPRSPKRIAAIVTACAVAAAGWARAGYFAVTSLLRRRGRGGQRHLPALHG